MEKQEMESIANAITEAIKPVVESLSAMLSDIQNSKKPEEEKPDLLSPGIEEFVKHATDPNTDPMKGRNL